MTSTNTAVEVHALSKSFRLPREQMHTLKERVLHPLRRTTHDEFVALHDVSFDVAKGEFFGIVGRNGSGKSTLLKCMAGIYRADRGRIVVDGRMSTFIELGVGFNPDLAAYDNVMLNATMLGLSTREAKRRYDAIIDFAELREFADLKIKNYSSGMLVRLAFSVMIQVDADVLLIDEVLAVGDAAFQQKCFDEFARIRKSGATVLLVTHDMGAVQRFCDRGLLLERGNIVEIGEPQRIGDRYLEMNFSREARARAAGEEAPAPETAPVREGVERHGDGRAEVVEVWFEGPEGNRAEVLEQWTTSHMAARVRFNEAIEDPVVYFALRNADDQPVFGISNRWSEPFGAFAAGEEAVFRASFEIAMAPDRYLAHIGVAPDENGLVWLDLVHRVAAIAVTGPPGEGLVRVPFRFEVERTPAMRREVVP